MIVLIIEWWEDQKYSLVAVVAVLCILASLPFFWIFRYFDFAAHEDVVKIQETQLVERTWEDDGKYIGGENKIVFTVDVEFDKYDVEALYTHTLVYDKDGFVGFLRTQHEGNTLNQEDGVDYYEKDTQQSLKFSWSKPANDNDAFFDKIYTGDLSDFTFVTKVIYVSFCDGTTVGRWSDVQYAYYDSEGNKKNDFPD